MKTGSPSRHPFALAALLPAALFTTIALTASAAPAPQADRYVAMAFSKSTQKYYGAWSSDRYRAIDGALDRCNAYQSNDAYDCISAGVAKNRYLAVALAKPGGPWGSSDGDTASDAGSRALGECRAYSDGGEYCRTVFNQHSSAH